MNQPDGITDTWPAMAETTLNTIDVILKGKGNIIEFGSGHSSKWLADKGYKVTAVEHDYRWVGLYPNVEYIHAPIVELPYSRAWQKRFGRRPCNWYNHEALKKGIEGKKFDLMIVDGPPANIGRSGLFASRKLFDWNFPIIFDDSTRTEEMSLIIYMAEALRSPYCLTVSRGRYATFSVIATSKEQLLEIINAI